MNALNQPFRFKSFLIWAVLLFFLALRLFWATAFPIVNDEVYYWDWSRHVQLSYLDAPPFVAWLAFLGTKFFAGSLGARFCLPFLHFFSVIFLILSLRLLFQNKDDCKVKHVLSLCLLTECIPVFNLEGFILLPDAGLLFAISGALYFLLRSVRCVAPVDSPLSSRSELSSSRGLIAGSIPCQRQALHNAVWVGVFLGLGLLSKYQVVPIGFGFFLGFLLFTGFSAWRFQLKYWLTVMVLLILISSPVIVWNAQNDWASFRFQSNHGFEGFHLNPRATGRYLLGCLFFLLPWYFYLFFKLVVFSFQKKTVFRQMDMIFLLPFLFLFSIIFFSALGKQALPHWAMPAFFILTPLLAKQLSSLTQKNHRLWLKTHVASVALAILLTSLPCFLFVQNGAQALTRYFKIEASDLEQMLLWPNLQKILAEKNLPVETAPYQQTPECSQNTPYLASLRWYWTAQMAFHFKDQPRVLNFDPDNPSYYTWRDNLEKFSGCSVIVVGSEAQFHKETLEKIMHIDTLKHLQSEDYSNTTIVFIQGILK